MLFKLLMRAGGDVWERRNGGWSETELANGVGIRRGCSQNVGGLLVATGGGMNAIFADTLQGEYRITPALGYPQNGLPGRFKFWAG